MGRATAPVSQGHYSHPGCVLIVLLRPLATALAGSPRHHKRKCLCPWLAASGQRVDYSLPAKEAGPRRSHPDAWVGGQPSLCEARRQEQKPAWWSSSCFFCRATLGTPPPPFPRMTNCLEIGCLDLAKDPPTATPGQLSEG